ncbi:hypothetical protein [Ornithobacterium rhinotracheale]|nr:hypothetical protein [Ornithobacterium rhinotracheale]
MLISSVQNQKIKDLIKLQQSRDRKNWSFGAKVAGKSFGFAKWF